MSGSKGEAPGVNLSAQLTVSLEGAFPGSSLQREEGKQIGFPVSGMSPH